MDMYVAPIPSYILLEYVVRYFTSINVGALTVNLWSESVRADLDVLEGRR